MSADCRTINAFTSDVEDYFHVAALPRPFRARRGADRSCASSEHRAPARSVSLSTPSTARFLCSDGSPSICLGLVKRIAACGHEVACHGYSHELVYRQAERAICGRDGALEGNAGGPDRQRGSNGLSSRKLFDHAGIAMGARYPH